MKLPAKIVRPRRLLRPDELRAILRACDRLPPYWGCLFQMLAATGQRKNEVTWLHHQEIDGATWTLPAERAKNRHEHPVPLSSLAQEIVARSPGKKTYLFESPLNANQPVHSTSRVTDQLRELSGVPHFRIHDLRHAYVTYSTQLNVPTRVIEAVVNHRGGEIQGVAAIYNHHSFEKEKRKAMELYADFLRRLINGRPYDDLDYTFYEIPISLPLAAE